MNTSLRLVTAFVVTATLSACAGVKPADTPPAAAEAVVPAPSVAGVDASTPAARPTVPPADDTATATASDAAADSAAPLQAAPVTEAEDDFSSIYGTPAPSTDDTGTPGGSPSYDPWESFNRRIHTFNNVVDRGVARPLAVAYTKTVPQPVRKGVTNFFNNLGQPVSALNALLQGKPDQAWASLGRFLINTTAGVGGVIDVATHDRVPNRSEDFGQTLAVWGWRNSRYVELPLFGPRTVRDTFGLVGDLPLSPTQRIENDKARIFLQGLQLVDVRAQLMAIDSLRDGAVDEYALFRDGWLQRRNYQITDGGQRGRDSDGDGLPDYLMDDDAPTVPVNAMPMIPTGGY
ncbi:MAG: VacJ family lipoprotein [Pseudoxanthomonas sp.]